MSPTASRPPINAGENERAILFCGTGIGVCISANKVPGIRAALTHDTYSAERAAKSNNAQIITMGARVIGPELAKAIVDAWLASEFDPAGPRRAMSRRSASSTRNTERRLSSRESGRPWLVRLSAEPPIPSSIASPSPSD